MYKKVLGIFYISTDVWRNPHRPPKSKVHELGIAAWFLASLLIMIVGMGYVLNLVVMICGNPDEINVFMKLVSILLWIGLAVVWGIASYLITDTIEYYLDKFLRKHFPSNAEW